MAHLKLPAAELKRIVKKLAGVSSGNTKIDFSTGLLQVIDNDMGVQVFAPAFRVSNFSVFVSSKLLNATAIKLTKEVTISCEESGPLSVSSAKFKGQIPLVKEPSWAAPPEWSGDALYTVPTGVLADLLGYASSVASDSATLDYTGSLRLSVNKEALEVAATDNFRVALAAGKRNSGLGEKLSVLVPSRMSRVIKDLEAGETVLSETEPALFFESGDVTVFSRKISKKFPAIEGVIPASFKLEVEVPAESFLDALQRVAPAVDTEGLSPKVELTFNGSSLKLKTGGKLTGQAEDEIEIKPLVPDAFEEPVTLVIHANHKFLCQYLTGTTESSILFRANDANKPFMMVSGNKRILMAGLKA